MRSTTIKHSLLTLSFVLPLSLIAESQQASAAEGFYLAPGFQAMNFDQGTGFDNDGGAFLGLGYDFANKLSVEFSSFELVTDTAGVADTKVDLDHYKIDFLYDLRDLDFKIGELTPFVLAGLGNTRFDSDNDTIIDLGVGMKYRLSDNMVWRTAIRSNTFLGRDREDKDLGIDTSLIFYFGGHPKRTSSAAPRSNVEGQSQVPRADADRDGIPDSSDNCADTPRNYAVDTRGCPVLVEEVARVELLVNFDFDQSVIKPEYFNEIEEIANFMEQYLDVVIELEGHTDSRGTEAYNRDLSQRRANAVREVLVNRFDIQGSRISSSGFGETQPTVSNDRGVGRAENRRVIAVIIKTLQEYQAR